MGPAVAARRLKPGPPPGFEQVPAPSLALKVIDDAIQAHSAAGVTSDFGLAGSYAAIRTLRLADGPDAVHRRVISKAELKRYSNDGPAR